MANKAAPYKQSYYLTNIDEWWNLKPEGNEFHSVDEMFVSYTRHQLKTLEYEAVLSLGDFRKCLYKQGVVMVSEHPRLYAQMESWRPSNDLVMRFSHVG